uniref:glutaminase n=1 Tax=Sphaeramia orbicularis TaxID=375764 RepID=A0A672YK96_9TELE
MAASLANGGLCPLSGDQVLSPMATRSMLSMMQVAGMKDYSTTFHFKTSVPAVSSSYGSLLAVVPGVLGLMAFSPELDACGNPWRAVHFCQKNKCNFNNSLPQFISLSFTHVHYNFHFNRTKHLVTGRILVKLHLLFLRHFRLFIFVQVIHIFFFFIKV